MKSTSWNTWATISCSNKFQPTKYSNTKCMIREMTLTDRKIIRVDLMYQLLRIMKSSRMEGMFLLIWTMTCWTNRVTVRNIVTREYWTDIPMLMELPSTMWQLVIWQRWWNPSRKYTPYLFLKVITQLLTFHSGQYYLPPYDECTVEYLRDIFAGRRKVSIRL